MPPRITSEPPLPQGLGIPSSPSTPLPVETDTQSPLQAPLRHRQQGTKDQEEQKRENMEAWVGEHRGGMLGSIGEGYWGGDTGHNMTDQGQQNETQIGRGTQGCPQRALQAL